MSARAQVILCCVASLGFAVAFVLTVLHGDEAVGVVCGMISLAFAERAWSTARADAQGILVPDDHKR